MTNNLLDRYGYFWKQEQWDYLAQIINTAKRQAAEWGQPLGGTPAQIEARFAKHYAYVWKLRVSTNPVTAAANLGVDGVPINTEEWAGQKSFDSADSKAYASAVKAVAKSKAGRKTTSVDDPTLSDYGYMWNLPPHKWSLPYRPTEAYPRFANNVFYETGQEGKALRRGRIRWRWASSAQVYVDSNGNQINIDVSDDRKYGFQFMWNPEQFSTSTAINYSSTASAADFAIKSPGWYPGAQNLDITVRLDRTNDFACFRTQNIDDIAKIPPATMAGWYPERIPNESDTLSYNRKVQDLLIMGTMSDVDYLYRTINDPKVMQNNLGKLRTADAGYLSFTPVEFTLGPIGYIGFITGISVNHIGFTEDYIPIRTDVTISARIMANSSSIAGTAGNPTRTIQTDAGDSSQGNTDPTKKLVKP